MAAIVVSVVDCVNGYRNDYYLFYGAIILYIVYCIEKEETVPKKNGKIFAFFPFYL